MEEDWGKEKDEGVFVQWLDLTLPEAKWTLNAQVVVIACLYK